MATRSEIIEQIEALSAHCRPPLMEAAVRGQWLADWCSDLADFPIDAIRAGCQKWRLSGSTKFPNAGQLLPMVRAGLPREALPAAEPPWEPLSQEQYEALDLRAKVRHRRIMASKARAKAGPMWANGAPVGPDELPARWHESTRVADEHEAAAERLQKLLRKSA